MSLINYYLKKKIKINHIGIKNFVHLGSPAQYEDFTNWRSVLIDKFHQCLNFNNSNRSLSYSFENTSKDAMTACGFKSN